MNKIDKKIEKFNKEMAANSKRTQARRALFQSKANPPTEESILDSALKTIEKIRETPRRLRIRRSKKADQSQSKAAPDGIADLPFSIIDGDMQSQFTYQMSDLMFASSKKKDNNERNKTSLESGSSNEYSEGLKSTLQLSSIHRGSDLFTSDCTTELEALPIDFSKLKITTDNSG